jgi:Zn-dependent alcohol dehydrogenase
MITHVMPLNEIDNAFELMTRGESIRGTHVATILGMTS